MTYVRKICYTKPMIMLTSSVASVAEHMYKNYLATKGYKTILFIDTAAEIEIGKVPDYDEWLLNDLQSLIDQGYEVDRFSITGKTQSEIAEQVNSHDIIYMCGGNTIHLLQQLRKTDSFNFIKDQVNSGKTYIGTSAGSIIAGPKLPIYLEAAEGITLDNYDAFGFINIIIAPHWGSDSFRKRYLDERLHKVCYKDQPPFLLLSDYQYVAVNDDNRMDIISTRT